MSKILFKTRNINLIADITFRFRLNEAHTNNEAMSYLTDHIFYDIQYSQDPNLEEAKSLLKRVHTRNLYKFICSYNLIFVSIIYNYTSKEVIFSHFICK